MIRLAAFLAFALMLLAISLVTLRFQTRELFVQAEQLRQQAGELDAQWRRLQLRQAELNRNARVDAMARSELQMEPINSKKTIYVTVPPAGKASVSQDKRP